MKKFLIVENLPVGLMFTEQALEGKYQTFCTATFEEAIEICRKELPDLLLCDFIIRGMTGLEFQKKLQEEFGAEEIPLVLMSADSNARTEAAALNDGARDFIRKPFYPEVLLSRIANDFRAVG